MKILFDAFWWAEGPPSLQRVLHATVLNWAKHFPQDEIAVIVPARDRLSLQGLPVNVTVYVTRLRPQGAAAVLSSGMVSRRFQPDVVLTQNFSALKSTALSCVFIHGLMFLEHPQWFTRAENLYFRGMSFFAPRADLILTSSEAEAGRIRRFVPNRKVESVGLGLDEVLSAVEPDVRIAQRLSLGEEGFVLSVGRLNARKNLQMTIEAALDTNLLSADLPLVIVGAPDGKQDQQSPRAKEAIDRGLIRYTGHISDAQLAWLYTNANLFVFMSLDEGFGLPPIEAEFFGAPVVVSDLPVFRESLGSSATFVSPTDTDQLRSVLARLIPITRPAGGSSLSGLSEHRWANTVSRMREHFVSALKEKQGEGSAT